MGCTGVDALAGAVAWWLDHPWHLLGAYLGTLCLRSFLAGFLVALVGRGRRGTPGDAPHV